MSRSDGGSVGRAAASVALGVAVTAEAPQVRQLVAPASLSRDDVIDLLGSRSALDAKIMVAPKRQEPKPTPSSCAASASRMRRTRLAVRARRHRADGQTLAASLDRSSPGIGGRPRLADLDFGAAQAHSLRKETYLMPARIGGRLVKRVGRLAKRVGRVVTAIPRTLLGR